MLTLSLTSYANYRVHGRIHSIITEFTIDTGAAVSLVRQDVWSRAAIDGGLQLVPWSRQTLVGVNGSPLQMHGQGLLQFMLLDKTFETSVIVASDLKDILAKSEIQCTTGQTLIMNTGQQCLWEVASS